MHLAVDALPPGRLARARETRTERSQSPVSTNTAPCFSAQPCNGDLRTGWKWRPADGAGQRAEGNRRVERPEGRGAHLGRADPARFGEDADGIDVRELALVGRHAVGRVALGELDMPVAFGMGELGPSGGRRSGNRRRLCPSAPATAQSGARLPGAMSPRPRPTGRTPRPDRRERSRRARAIGQAVAEPGRCRRQRRRAPSPRASRAPGRRPCASDQLALRRDGRRVDHRAAAARHGQGVGFESRSSPVVRVGRYADSRLPPCACRSRPHRDDPRLCPSRLAAARCGIDDRRDLDPGGLQVAGERIAGCRCW